MLLGGELDVAPIPAIEYARHADDFVLLPDIAISSDGEVQSILLLSKVPAEELGGRTVALTNTSRTSQVLARVLLEKRWGVSADYVEMPPDLPADAARCRRRAADRRRRAARVLAAARRPARYDLGTEWTRVDRPADGVRRLGGATRPSPRTAPEAVQPRRPTPS